MRPCQEHLHPHLIRPVSREQVRQELARLYRRAGRPGPLDLHWTDDLRRTHDANWRRYAQVAPYQEVPRFELAPQTVYLPSKNRRGLLAHEVGHVLDPDGDEDEADEAAHRALGIKIAYDHRWPGKGLQVARSNPRARGFLLDQLLGDSRLSSQWRPPLEAAQRVVADEPMAWYFEESDKEYWNEREEFRNVAPPFPILWIEHKAPRYIRSEEYGLVPWPEENWDRAGTLLMSLPKEEMDIVDPEVSSYFPTSKWIVSAVVFTTPYSIYHQTSGPRWRFVYGVEPDGSLSMMVGEGDFLSHPEGDVTELIKTAPPGPIRDRIADDAGQFYKGPWRVALLSVYFMHSKGASLREKRVPAKVAEKRRRKGRPTGEGYKVLDVGLGARRSLEEAKSEGGGSRSALRKHLRRGGFAVYRPDRPHVSGFVGSMWRSPTIVSRGEEQIEKDYRVRTEEGRKKRRKKRKRRKNPSEHEQVREAHRRFVSSGDQEDFEDWVKARRRIGLPPYPRELDSWEDVPEDDRTAARSLAVQRSRPSHKRKRMRVREAERVIETWLRERGWHPDSRATVNDVWISPSGRERVVFKRTNVVFEKGRRGHWVRNYDIHRWGDALGTIDFAERLILNTQRNLAKYASDPYAPNPGEFLPARIGTETGAPPRIMNFELMARGEAPLIYVPPGARGTRSLPAVTHALGSMLSRPPLEGGLADPNAWENLLAAVGHATSSKLYVVDRNGERWRVLRVSWDPGGLTGEVELQHQGRLGRGGRTHWVDLQQAYGRMIPVVVYRGA